MEALCLVAAEELDVSPSGIAPAILRFLPVRIRRTSLRIPSLC
jgi:hypothetical protein